MFSALKKLVGSEQAPGRDKNIPAGLQSMNQALQRRFAKGVQYNMKIVIRGDRNTGKTALWHRLQGRPFVEEYIPTQEIQVTSIHWSYKTTDDIVKVEVWDVVDKGKCKKRGDGLKMENDPQEAESDMALDAEFLDVYKSCNGVVMMFDITKQWTFNYILRELPKVPTHVPVCVLGNYRDMGEHRVILPDDVRDFIDNLDRPPGSSYFRYAESSMKNSFGLKYLHKFFNIPFLQLQRETLLRQLETNQLDMDATLEELSVQQETEDQNYGIFLEMMEARSRGHASPLVANGQSPSSGSQSPVVPPGAVSTGSSSPGTPQPAPQLPLNAAPPCSVPPAPPSEALPPPACPSAPPRGAASSRGCLGRHLPPRQPLYLQSQSWPRRPQQQCRAWRTLFPTTAWTAASSKMRPPPGTRRRWGPRLPSRTATVMRRPWAATQWWQGSRTMWTSKTSHMGVPHHLLVPSPVRTSLFQVRRKQKWWIPQKALPRLPSSAQSQRPSGPPYQLQSHGGGQLPGGPQHCPGQAVPLFAQVRKSTAAPGPLLRLSRGRVSRRPHPRVTPRGPSLHRCCPLSWMTPTLRARRQTHSAGWMSFPCEMTPPM